MMTRLFAVVIVSTVLATGVVAQEPSDTVQWAGAGRVALTSTVIAPDGCYSAGRAKVGAPAGATVIERAALVTFPLVHADGVACTQATQPVKFSITVDAPAGTQAIVIYTTDPLGKSVSARAVALPRR